MLDACQEKTNTSLLTADLEMILERMKDMKRRLTLYDRQKKGLKKRKGKIVWRRL